MSAQIRVSYTRPHELEAVETALLAAGLAPKVKQAKEQRGRYFRAYIRISEQMFDKSEQMFYNEPVQIEREYPIPIP